MDNFTIKRALISVYDKTGIIELGKFLQEKNIEILSTGGTYNILKENNITCIKIEDWTNQKEIFNGRVKTLHSKIHSGILSPRNKESIELNIETIDLVIVNLYPFEKIVESNEKDIDKLIEMIDIGGPTMLRAAAKNYKYCCPICDPKFYNVIINEIIESGSISLKTRSLLALEVFKLTSYYDSLISRILYKNFNSDTEKNDLIFEDKTAIPLKKEIDTRYGENPHQKGFYYSIPDYPDEKLSYFFTEGKIWGKELSYNNILDINSVIRILGDMEENSCVVVKHNNPCGAASKKTCFDSFKASYEGDRISIFGGIVGFKGIVDVETALLLDKIFLEIIICKKFLPEACEILKKKKNLRLLEYNKWENSIFSDNKIPDIKRVIGGFLIQEKDTINPFYEQYKVVTNLIPTEKELEDLKFGQIIVKYVKSNGIVIVKDKMLVGVGAGQMNRVTSAKIALDWAGEKSIGAVLASDAFFPMPDTIYLAKERGITAIIQPGGSIKDDESIEAANKCGIKMIFTGIRHFLH